MNFWGTWFGGFMSGMGFTWMLFALVLVPILVRKERKAHGCDSGTSLGCEHTLAASE